MSETPTDPALQAEAQKVAEQQEKSKTYDRPEDDPAYSQFQAEITKATNVDAEDARQGKFGKSAQDEANGNYGNYWMRQNIRINMQKWNEFTRQYPEKAKAYQDKNTWIGKALGWQQESRPVSQVDNPTTQSGPLEGKSPNEQADMLKNWMAEDGESADGSNEIAPLQNEGENNTDISIPDKYKGMPSEMVEEMWVNTEYGDKETNKLLEERREQSLQAIKEQEQVREQTKAQESNARYTALPDEQKQGFPAAQQEVNSIIASAIRGERQIDDLLKPEDQWILNKAKEIFERQKEENPDASLTVQFEKPLDKAIYANLVNRLAFKLLTENGQVADQEKANDIRASLDLPKQPIDTTDLKLANGGRIENPAQNKTVEDAGIPKQEAKSETPANNETAVIDQEAKKRSEQQKFGLSSSILTNYFDGKFNLGNLLTNAEVSQLESLRAPYQKNKVEQTPFTISIGNLSPELRKLIIEDLPILFKSSNTTAVERAKQQREGNTKENTGEPNEAGVQPPELKQQEAEAVGKTEWKDVRRSTEVAAIGDLYGSAEALQANMEALGVAQVGPDGKFQWTGADKKIVFMGDIAGDRQMHGLDDLVKIGELNKQAEADGGSIDVLVGNHDDFLVSFLMDTDGGGQADAWLSCKQGGYDGLLELCRFGSDELKKGFEDYQQLDNAKKEEVWSKLKTERSQILQNMRADTEGQQILDALCTMKIATIKDDSLFCHTDPTLSMMRTLLSNGPDKLGKTVDKINDIYQSSLREYLIEGKPIADAQGFGWIKDAFIDTNNREAFFQDDRMRFDQQAIDAMVSQIRDGGINGIIHGHSNKDYYSAPKDLMVTSVELGAYSNKYSTKERSVLNIGKDGKTNKGVDSRSVRQ